MGVPWSTVANIASPDSVDALQPLVSPSGRLYLWGFRSNARIRRPVLHKPPQSWARMLPGALLVFTNRETASHVGVIGARLFDPAMSPLVWGTDEFPWIVGLTGLREVTGVSSEEVREAAQFKRIAMAHPVRPDRRENVYDLLASADSAAREPELEPSEVPEVSGFDPELPTSVLAEVERRLEQAWLRKQLVTGPEAECDLCGTVLPAAFLRAAHIKPRHLCSDSERRDTSNVLLACVTCDVAFERGWLGLDSTSRVVISGSLPRTADLDERLNRIRGRAVARALNAESIRFHRERLFSA